MRNQPHKPNSADIARLAGVSRSTVSRVINGYANVPETTRQRVISAIEHNGYYPSISGQILRGKRSRCVGVFLAESGKADDAQAALLYAFSQSAQALGYMTLSGRMGSFDTPDCGRQVREVMCSGYVDAGVFLDPPGGETLIRQLVWEGHTIGVLGALSGMEHERFFTVETNVDFANQTVQYALSQGYRHAMFLGGFAGTPDAPMLVAHFQAVSAESGLQLNALSSDFHSLLHAFSGIGQQPYTMPELVICTNHSSLYAAYRAAAASGLIVGRDVSILGAGLLATCLPLLPVPTSFCFEPSALATSLASRMIRCIEGATNEPRRERLPCQFERGDSFVAVGQA